MNRPNTWWRWATTISLCSWILLVRNSERDTVRTALPCSMISGASARMTQLAGPGTAGSGGSASMMASSLLCLAPRLGWLKNRTNRELWTKLPHESSPAGRTGRKFSSKWSRSLMAFYNLASKVSFTSTLLHGLKPSKTSPPGLWGRNHPENLWTYFKTTLPFFHPFSPLHHHQHVHKTALNPTAKMILWNEIKVSPFCPNPSHNFHFTQRKCQNPYNGHKAPWLGLLSHLYFPDIEVPVPILPSSPYLTFLLYKRSS